MDTPISSSVRAPLPAVGALFGGAWSLYKSRFGTLIGIVAVPLLLSFASVLVAAFGGAGFVTGMSVWIAGIVGIVGGILSVVAYIGLVYALREPIGFGAAYRRGFSRFFSYIWVSILMTLIVIGGYVMGIIPGIVFSVWFVFGTFTLLLEEKRGMEAILRSKEYVRGYWWPVFGRMLLMMLAAFAIALIIGIPAGSFSGKPDEEVNVIGALASAVMQILLTPFIVAFLYTLYEHLRGAKPELAASPIPAKGKGFFIFSAILGIIAPIILFVAGFALLSALFLSKAATSFDLSEPNNLLDALKNIDVPADLGSPSGMEIDGDFVPLPVVE